MMFKIIIILVFCLKSLSIIILIVRFLLKVISKLQRDHWFNSYLSFYLFVSLNIFNLSLVHIHFINNWMPYLFSFIFAYYQKVNLSRMLFNVESCFYLFNLSLCSSHIGITKTLFKSYLFFLIQKEFSDLILCIFKSFLKLH